MPACIWSMQPACLLCRASCIMHLKAGAFSILPTTRTSRIFFIFSRPISMRNHLTWQRSSWRPFPRRWCGWSCTSGANTSSAQPSWRWPPAPEERRCFWAAPRRSASKAARCGPQTYCTSSSRPTASAAVDASVATLRANKKNKSATKSAHWVYFKWI